MHLQPGDRLQIHCPTHPDRARHISRVIGFVDDLSLLVTVPAPQGVRTPFMEHELVIVQTFSRNSAYAFKSTIQKIQRLPFDYMHLTIPDRVQASVIRKATRVRLKLEVKLTPAGGESLSGNIENISATGALISAPEALAAVGDELRLAFSVTLHEVPSDISLTARVLKVHPGENQTLHGVEFTDISMQDRMILQGLIYQQMIDKPRSLA